MVRFRLQILSMCLAVAVALIPLASLRAWDRTIDSPMFRDPAPPRGHIVKVFPKGIASLWRDVLEQPGVDLPCQAALAIADAHRLGMKHVDSAIPILRRLIDRQGQHPDIYLATARALIELNARSAAPSLFRHAESGDRDLRDLIEPALARWHDADIVPVWLERLRNAYADDWGRVLAMRGLAQMQEQKAVGLLHELLFADRTPTPLFEEAARALGMIRTTGGENDARRLAASPERKRRLAAVLLLSRHSSSSAIDIIKRLVEDPEPAVVRAALDRLTQLDPKQVPHPDRLLRHSDAMVRLKALDVVFHEITEARLAWLAERCDDIHPEVRHQARTLLHTLAARSKFREAILKHSVALLNGTDWRGQEQAAILLAELDYHLVNQRLLKLLRADRPEVCVAAGWALRRLADPETLPPVLAYVRGTHDDVNENRKDPALETAFVLGFDEQMSQLVQLLGKSRYGPADSVLRHLAPRDTPRPHSPYGAKTRAAAFWALGLLHQGHADPDVVRIAEKPLRDVQRLIFDDARVYRMCAITLGRMRSKDSVSLLHQFFRTGKPNLDPVNNAAGWAIEQITGKPIPHDAEILRTIGGWSLRPAGK